VTRRHHRREWSVGFDGFGLLVIFVRVITRHAHLVIFILIITRPAHLVIFVLVITGRAHLVIFVLVITGPAINFNILATHHALNHCKKLV